MTHTTLDATTTGKSRDVSAKALLLVPSLWLGGVFTYLVIAVATGAMRQSEPMVIFALCESAAVIGAMGAAWALHGRRWAAAFLLGFGTLLMVGQLFIYFPMGVAECQEWVQHNVGASRP
jgi:hypothetical protein